MSNGKQKRGFGQVLSVQDSMTPKEAHTFFGDRKAILDKCKVLPDEAVGFRRVWVNSTPHSIWHIGKVASPDKAIREKMGIVKGQRGFVDAQGNKVTLSALGLPAEQHPYNINLPRKLQGEDEEDTTDEAKKEEPAKA